MVISFYFSRIFMVFTFLVTIGLLPLQCNCSVKSVIADSKKLFTFAARPIAHYFRRVYDV